MPFTLSNLLQGMFKELGQLTVSKATGGSTTTVVDTTILNRYADDAMKEGAMFVVRDAGGANAAPEGQFQRISAYVDSTTTFTVDTALTVAVASGDTYGWASPRYPLQTMIEMANDALRGLGDVSLIDTTTLDTAAAQTEYTASVAWKRARPYRVDIQTILNDSNDNRWIETKAWEWIPAAAGSTGLLVFNFQPIASRDIRVWYKGPHGLLNAYSDVVNEAIDPELAVIAGALKAAEWQNSRTQGSDQFLLQKINKLENILMQRKAETPITRVKRQSKLLVVGPDSTSLDYITPPPRP